MVAVFYILGVAFVSFENLAVITTINGLLVLVFGKGPRMSMAASSNGLVGGNRYSLRCLFVAQRFHAYDWQSSTVPYSSLAMWG